MKKSTKAVLLSGLILPGLGHIYLKKYLIGLVLLCVSGLAVFTFTKVTVNAALEVAAEIESGNVALDAQSITQRVEQLSPEDEQSADRAIWVLMICWIIGIVDSYRVGSRQERMEESSETIEKSQ